jgi:hypothetical protein
MRFSEVDRASLENALGARRAFNRVLRLAR